jgi:hypothetical protein
LKNRRQYLLQIDQVGRTGLIWAISRIFKNHYSPGQLGFVLLKFRVGFLEDWRKSGPTIVKSKITWGCRRRGGPGWKPSPKPGRSLRKRISSRVPRGEWSLRGSGDWANALRRPARGLGRKVSRGPLPRLWTASPAHWAGAGSPIGPMSEKVDRVT